MAAPAYGMAPVADADSADCKGGSGLADSLFDRQLSHPTPSRVIALATVLPLFLLMLVLWSPLLLAHGKEKHGDKATAPAAEPVVLAPGYEPLNFDAPLAGSYELPPIGAAGDGVVLDSDGSTTSLHTLMDGKLTVLSFIYRACNDVNGCPLATFVMHQLSQQLENHPALAKSTRLLSMSFDPLNDTPESMAAYRESFSNEQIDWRFITSPSIEALKPVLKSYNQPLSETALMEQDAPINHLLRVYLIDEHRKVRNIYSVSFLHAETLLHDLATIADASDNQRLQAAAHSLLGNTATAAAETVQVDANVTTAVGTGSTTTAVQDNANSSDSADGSVALLTQAEDRSGYASGQYVSQSYTLAQQGEAADLYRLATQTMPGLPVLNGAEALSPEKIELGRRLFYDRRLSINETFSCAMCHIPQQAFTSNEIRTAVGVEGRTVKRNTPTLLNVGFLSSLFQDGRESSLEQQVWSPLLAHNEMANPSIGYVLDKVERLDNYAELFARVYGSATPTMATLGDTLAAYQRSLVAGDSAFDRWYYQSDQAALPVSAQRGFELFVGKAGCAACHSVSRQHALFTDELLHNTGVGYAQSFRSHKVPHEVTLAPGIVVKVDPAVYAAAAEKPPVDLGRYDVTLNPSDRWKFRTPSLRNVSLTAPYMHDGSLATLADVIDFYDRGGIDNPLLSPLIRPLGLTATERDDLHRFLESLVGSSVALLVKDGQAAPIGDL